MNVSAHNPASRFRRVSWTLACGAWLFVLSIGLVAMARFDWTEGRRGDVPSHWPADSIHARATDRPTLVLALHPLCPCGRASLALLTELASHHPGSFDLLILFLMPAVPDPAWAEAQAWRDARAIPGARIAADPRGIESARFGARTSGHALMFDSAGRRLFEGGLTPGRGMAGAGAGFAAVQDILRSDVPRTTSAPVFGCDLFALSEQCGPAGGDCR